MNLTGRQHLPGRCDLLWPDERRNYSEAFGGAYELRCVRRKDHTGAHEYEWRPVPPRTVTDEDNPR